MTSSNCRSSIKLRSLISASRGWRLESAIGSGFYWCRRARRRPGGPERLRQLQFLQLGLDGGRILALGDNFFARDKALLVLLHKKAIQRDHAILRAGLDVRSDTKSFVVTNKRGDRRSIDHDLENRHPARFVDSR